MSPANVLHCGVVGAGIAGLGAAIALRRAGHDVEVYEKSQFKNEIGAAISFTPNANKILAHWGVDQTKAGETNKQQFRRLDAGTLECLARHDFSHVEQRYGHRFSAYHRVDIHNQMRETAVSEELPGEPVRINLGTPVVDVDCPKGALLLEDGTDIRKDLIVIADGVKSRFLETVAGVPIPTLKTGKSVYRTLIPMDRIRNDRLVWQMYENEPSGFCNALSLQTGTFFVTYPCRNDEVMNVAVFHMTREDQRDRDDWNSPAMVEDALDQLKTGFHPAWSALLKHADFMNCYTVSHRDPAARMTRGKVVLIGDAAHPMQPTHAQGGSMSIEDAAALEVLFSGFGDNDSVDGRLEVFDALRIPRDIVTALLSNAMFYNESPAQITEKIREYYQGPLLPSNTEGWSEAIQEFFYPYNVFVEASKALAYQDAVSGGDRIPEGVIKHFGEVNA